MDDETKKGTTQKENEDKEGLAALTKMVGKLCQIVGDEHGKPGGQGGTAGNRGQPPKKTGVCYVCQEPSHWAAQCPMRFGDSSAAKGAGVGALVEEAGDPTPASGPIRRVGSRGKCPPVCRPGFP